MKLGTRLILFLSLIIIVVLCGYGYFHISSRRDVLVKMMRLEVRSIAETLKFSLKKIALQREMAYVRDLIDAVSEPERTLGVIFYDPARDLVIHSSSLEGETETFLKLIKRSIEEDRVREEFGVYGGTPVFSYSSLIKDQRGKVLGGICIVQHTSFIEKDIEASKGTILATLLLLIGGTIAWVFYFTRRWITRPLSSLKEAIEEMSKGDLNARIELKRGDEISKLAQTFNQMAVDLRAAQERLIQEGEAKLELERNLRQSEKLATIGQLASGLAHEVGTPLNIISGRAELIKRRPEDRASLQKNIEAILHQTERITRIIQQLLGFVRKKRPEQTSLNIGTLLEATLDFVDPHMEKQKVKVVKEFESPLPSVRGDSDQLQQVFLNLILNALQAMPRGGTLRLAVSPKWISREGLASHKQEYLEIAVEDTGVGMDEEVKKNLFQPFFTTKEREKGTGLGLTVCLGIIQDHEGWIEVESEKGRGSKFRMFLPALPSKLDGNQTTESQA